MGELNKSNENCDNCPPASTAFPPKTRLVVDAPDGNNGWYCNQPQIALEIVSSTEGLLQAEDKLILNSVDPTQLSKVGAIVDTISVSNLNGSEFFVLDVDYTIEQDPVTLVTTITRTENSKIEDGEEVLVRYQFENETQIFYAWLTLNVDGNLVVEQDFQVYENPIEIFGQDEHILSFFGLDRNGNAELAKRVLFKLDTTCPLTSDDEELIFGSKVIIYNDSETVLSNFSLQNAENDVLFFSSQESDPTQTGIIQLFVRDLESNDATTYYTTDGTEPDPDNLQTEGNPDGNTFVGRTIILPPGTQKFVIKFFSIDRSGNREPTRCLHNFNPASSPDRFNNWIEINPDPQGNDDPNLNNIDKNTGELVPNKWYNSPPIVALPQPGDIPGLLKTFYRFGDDDYREFVCPFLVSDEGENVLQWYVVFAEALDSSQTLQERAILVDTSPPVTEDNVSPIWTNADAIIRLEPRDLGSGVAKTFYDVYVAIENPDGTFSKGESIFPDTQEGEIVVVEIEGSFILSYWSVDIAGNIETRKDSQNLIRIDKTRPLSFLIAPRQTDGSRCIVPGPCIYTQNPDISLAADDPESQFDQEMSGVESIQYKFDSQEVYTQFVQPFKMPGNGRHILTFFAQDNAGNREQLNAVTLELNEQIETTDVSPPSILGIIPKNGDTGAAQQPTVAFMIDDDQSGVDLESIEVILNSTRFAVSFIPAIDIFNKTEDEIVVRVANNFEILKAGVPVYSIRFEEEVRTIEELVADIENKVEDIEPRASSVLAGSLQIVQLRPITKTIDAGSADILFLEEEDENSFVWEERNNGYFIRVTPLAPYPSGREIQCIINASDNVNNVMPTYISRFFAREVSTFQPCRLEELYRDSILEHTNRIQIRAASTYNRNEYTDFFGFFKAFGFELARLLLDAQDSLEDRYYVDTRPQFLKRNLGTILNYDDFKSISQEKARELLLTLIEAHYIGSSDLGMRTGISAFIEGTIEDVEIIEGFKFSDDISDSFIALVTIFAEQTDDGQILGILKGDVDIFSSSLITFLRDFRPAHVYLLDSFGFKENFNLQDGCDPILLRQETVGCRIEVVDKDQEGSECFERLGRCQILGRILTVNVEENFFVVDQNGFEIEIIPDERARFVDGIEKEIITLGDLQIGWCVKVDVLVNEESPYLFFDNRLNNPFYQEYIFSHPENMVPGNVIFDFTVARIQTIDGFDCVNKNNPTAYCDTFAWSVIRDNCEVFRKDCFCEELSAERYGEEVTDQIQDGRDTFCLSFKPFLKASDLCGDLFLADSVDDIEVYVNDISVPIRTFDPIRGSVTLETEPRPGDRVMIFYHYNPYLIAYSNTLNYSLDPDDCTLRIFFDSPIVYQAIGNSARLNNPPDRLNTTFRLANIEVIGRDDSEDLAEVINRIRMHFMTEIVFEAPVYRRPRLLCPFDEVPAFQLSGARSLNSRLNVIENEPSAGKLANFSSVTECVTDHARLCDKLLQVDWNSGFEEKATPFALNARDDARLNGCSRLQVFRLFVKEAKVFWEVEAPENIPVDPPTFGGEIEESTCAHVMAIP